MVNSPDLSGFSDTHTHRTHPHQTTTMGNHLSTPPAPKPEHNPNDDITMTNTNQTLARIRINPQPNQEPIIGMTYLPTTAQASISSLLTYISGLSFMPRNHKLIIDDISLIWREGKVEHEDLLLALDKVWLQKERAVIVVSAVRDGADQAAIEGKVEEGEGLESGKGKGKEMEKGGSETSDDVDAMNADVGSAHRELVEGVEEVKGGEGSEDSRAREQQGVTVFTNEGQRMQQTQGLGDYDTKQRTRYGVKESGPALGAKPSGLDTSIQAALDHGESGASDDLHKRETYPKQEFGTTARAEHKETDLAASSETAPTTSDKDADALDREIRQQELQARLTASLAKRGKLSTVTASPPSPVPGASGKPASMASSPHSLGTGTTTIPSDRLADHSRTSEEVEMKATGHPMATTTTTTTEPPQTTTAPRVSAFQRRSTSWLMGMGGPESSAFGARQYPLGSHVSATAGTSSRDSADTYHPYPAVSTGSTAALGVNVPPSQRTERGLATVWNSADMFVPELLDAGIGDGPSSGEGSEKTGDDHSGQGRLEKMVEDLEADEEL